MSTLTLDQVAYRYKDSPKPVLNGINCHIDEGQIVAIIGPSGSGKTTLLSLMAGLDSPTEGCVSLDNESLARKNLDVYRRQEASVIFQSFRLFPLLTALENVCYPMELNGVPLKQAKERAVQLLERVGISTEKHKRFPAHLSGGEQQRVAIARALASGAKLLLADEPTGNLDQENSRNIIALLAELAHQENYAIAIVTHDLAIAESADRVYQMADGTLHELA
jgi:putative ABC transport system ATP-binding protein